MTSTLAAHPVSRLSQICKVVAIETTRGLRLGEAGHDLWWEDGSDPGLTGRKKGCLVAGALGKGLRKSPGTPRRRGLELRLLLAVCGGEPETDFLA